MLAVSALSSELTLVTTIFYRWEYFTTLDFEWEVYTGRRQWRWSFLVYVSARLLALACVIAGLVGFNLTREFNCTVRLPSVCRKFRSVLIPPHLDIALASLRTGTNSAVPRMSIVVDNLSQITAWFAACSASLLLVLRG